MTDTGVCHRLADTHEVHHPRVRIERRTTATPGEHRWRRPRRACRPGRSSCPGRPRRSGRPPRSGRLPRSGRPRRSGRTCRARSTGRARATCRAGAPGRPGSSDRAGQPCRPRGTSRAGSSGRAGRTRGTSRTGGTRGTSRTGRTRGTSRAGSSGRAGRTIGPVAPVGPFGPTLGQSTSTSIPGVHGVGRIGKFTPGASIMRTFPVELPLVILTHPLITPPGPGLPMQGGQRAAHTKSPQARQQKTPSGLSVPLQGGHLTERGSMRPCTRRLARSAVTLGTATDALPGAQFREHPPTAQFREHPPTLRRPQRHQQLLFPVFFAARWKCPPEHRKRGLSCALGFTPGLAGRSSRRCQGLRTRRRRPPSPF